MQQEIEELSCDVHRLEVHSLADSADRARTPDVSSVPEIEQQATYIMVVQKKYHKLYTAADRPELQLKMDCHR